MTITRRLLLPLIFVSGATAAAFALRKWVNRFRENQTHGEKTLQVWEGEGGHLEPSPMTSHLS
jgi:hypothetical protein